MFSNAERKPSKKGASSQEPNSWLLRQTTGHLGMHFLQEDCAVPNPLSNTYIEKRKPLRQGSALYPRHTEHLQLCPQLCC